MTLWRPNGRRGIIPYSWQAPLKVTSRPLWSWHSPVFSPQTYGTGTQVASASDLKPGGGFAAAQATASLRPLYFATSPLGGRPAWWVDGVDDFLEYAAGHAALAAGTNTPLCAYWVWQSSITSGTTSNIVRPLCFGWSGGATHLFHFFGGVEATGNTFLWNFGRRSGGATVITAPGANQTSMPIASKCLVRAFFDSTQVNIRCNGNTVAFLNPASTPASLTSDKSAMGALIRSTVSFGTWPGYFGDHILFSGGELSASDDAMVVDYLTRLYGPFP